MLGCSNADLDRNCCCLSLKAAALGSKVAPPLAICIAEFQNSVEIASRASCSVSRAQWRGKPVAVKKAKISSSRDLEFFRREAVLLSKLTHPNMTALLAARLLPPGAIFTRFLVACSKCRQSPSLSAPIKCVFRLAAISQQRQVLRTVCICRCISNITRCSLWLT